MRRTPLLSLAILFAGSLAAQSNTVAGLDGRLSVVDSLTYYGRRGAANPGGEVGMAMLNTMCNPGTVQIPWQAAMLPNHPKFGFLIVRESGGRIVQISDRSFCKHAFVSSNFDGACGTCQSTGGLGGTVMGIHCSDTYGPGNNASRDDLGPADEIDPWLGTWVPLGSYFDRGFPDVGAPANHDGVRSQINPTDEVMNRVTVKESDLLVAGANYYYGIHLIHQGEAVANRGDNLASRGFNPAWNGTVWTFNNNAHGQIYGSILQHWTGATVNSGGNGNDDGRFFVGVLVTNPSPGVYHYEYAVHNVDNSRGGASFRVPVAAGATVSNFGFRDIDSNALNDWTASRVGNEIRFLATAANPLNWNTIYNFSFDCSQSPSFGTALIDEARVGPGLLTVNVDSQVPSGVPTATVSSVGSGCGACSRSFYEEFGSPSSMDLGGHSLKMVLSGGIYTVSTGTNAFVAPTGASLNLVDDSHASVALPFSLPYPGGSTSSLEVCSNGFISPVTGNGDSWTPNAAEFLAGLPRWAVAWHDFVPNGLNLPNVRTDISPSVVRVTWQGVPDFGAPGTSTMQCQFEPNGTVTFIWVSMSNQGSAYLVGWTPGAGANDPGSRDISASLAAGFSVCASDSSGLALTASARPILGTQVDLTTTGIPAGSPFGAMLLSLTQAPSPGQDLGPIGMPGCFGQTLNAVSLPFFAPPATYIFHQPIPNQASLIGLHVIAQSFTYSPPLTPLGAIAANGLVMVLGL